MSGLPPRRPTAGRVRWRSCNIPGLGVSAVWSELSRGDEAHRCQTPRESSVSSHPCFSPRIPIQLLADSEQLILVPESKIGTLRSFTLSSVLPLLENSLLNFFFFKDRKVSGLCLIVQVLYKAYKWSFRNLFRGIGKSKPLDGIPWPGLGTLILIHPRDSWPEAVESLPFAL